MTAPVNDMSLPEAVDYYESIGMCPHPLSRPDDHGNSPGKRPLLEDWSNYKPLSDRDKVKYFKNNRCNIGNVCGQVSDVTVIDRDFICKGIWDYIFEGIDTTDFVIQSRTTGRDHLWFNYSPIIDSMKHHALGFEVLNNGSNVVITPSEHVSGAKYQFNKNPTERPHLPEEAVVRIKEVTKTLSSLESKVNKCRPTFQKFFKAHFTDNQKSNPHFRDMSVFHGASGRELTLHLFAELSRNGATKQELMLLCMLIFMDDYDAEMSAYQIDKINPNATATTESIKAHPVLSQFHIDREKAPVNPREQEYISQKDDGVDEIDSQIKEAAAAIAEGGDPVQFILDTHQSLHVGDLELAKTLLVSVGVQSVLNADGIQPKVSGESGKGKTHCCKAMAHLVPPEWIFETTLSDKAIFYMKGLKDGSIIFCDDIDLSETLEGVIKRATSNFQTGTTYTTLDIKRREETKRIPSRISWWLTSVDDDQSLQLLNRQFGGGVDESEEQDRKVVEFLSKKAASGEVGLPLNDNVLICREILRDIKSSNYIVKIPFVERITWRDTRNRRNYSIFLDILRGYTVLRHRQRQKDHEGALIAEVQDFNDAKALYTGRAGNQGLKLSDAEMRLCMVLAGRGEATREEIAKALGKSVGRVSHLIYGKDRNKDAGLLHKVEGFYVEKRIVENSAGHKTLKTYLKLDKFDALGMFDSVVSLDAGDTHCYPTDTPTDTSINNNNRHTDTTDTNIDRVRQKTLNCVKTEKSDSLRTQKSKQGISGISGSTDSEKGGNSGSNIAGNSASAPPHDIDNMGNTAMLEHLLAWAPQWESSHKKSINHLNVTHVAMEYCKRYSVPSDKFTEVNDIIRRYAKISTERPMSGPLDTEGEQTQAHCVDCGSSPALNKSILINGQTEHRCHECYQKYVNRAVKHPDQPGLVEGSL